MTFIGFLWRGVLLEIILVGLLGITAALLAKPLISRWGSGAAKRWIDARGGKKTTLRDLPIGFKLALAYAYLSTAVFCVVHTTMVWGFTLAYVNEIEASLFYKALVVLWSFAWPLMSGKFDAYSFYCVAATLLTLALSPWVWDNLPGRVAQIFLERNLLWLS